MVTEGNKGKYNQKCYKYAFRLSILVTIYVEKQLINSGSLLDAVKRDKKFLKKSLPANSGFNKPHHRERKR